MTEPPAKQGYQKQKSQIARKPEDAVLNRGTRGEAGEDNVIVPPPFLLTTHKPTCEDHERRYAGWRDSVAKALVQSPHVRSHRLFAHKQRIACMHAPQRDELGHDAHVGQVRIRSSKQLRLSRGCICISVPQELVGAT